MSKVDELKALTDMVLGRDPVHAQAVVRQVSTYAAILAGFAVLIIAATGLVYLFGRCPR